MSIELKQLNSALKSLHYEFEINNKEKETLKKENNELNRIVGKIQEEQS